MSKFSIFTSFLAVILVIIVAELMVNEYLTYPELDTEIMANVLDESEGVSDEIPAEEIITGKMDVASDSGDEGSGADEQNIVPIINFALLGDAGSTGLTLQRVPFNGILFESLDLRDFKSVPVIKQNLLQNNRKEIGTAYEFRGDSKLIAKEIYLLLKDNAFRLANAGINETNSYGDGSFFVNYEERPTTAFLVVKLGSNVYALSYQKDFHTFIENIIALLP